MFVWCTIVSRYEFNAIIQARCLSIVSEKMDALMIACRKVMVFGFLDDQVGALLGSSRVNYCNRIFEIVLL